ncbi:MAG: class I SAM-dependent methyltransferase [Candidatus Woesearchaeota archaeon]|nr:class I SAM-dependent methyltransferase [Candidatus Woesearchaeota archaeon]
MIRDFYRGLKQAISSILSLIFTERGFLFLSAIDKSIRYKNVAKEIKKFKEKDEKLKILDVGGGYSPLCYLLDKRNFDLTVLDVSKEELEQLKNKKNIKTIIADASEKIPFANRSFDIVASVASFEHVKAEKRKKYIRELKRVAKKSVVLYVQTDKIAEYYDRKIHGFRTKIGIKDEWTEEHMKYGLPTTEQLKAFFPDARIMKMQNASVWYCIMIMQSTPIFELIFPGIIYALVLRWSDNRKPFIATLLNWKK